MEQMHIDEIVLKELLTKTLAFLDMVGTPNSALRSDFRLLQRAGEVAGLLARSESDHNTNSSFSSTTTDAYTGGH